MSDLSDYQSEAAFEVYKQHKMKLERLSKIYMRELVAEKRKSNEEN
jgi:hypothetical protein